MCQAYAALADVPRCGARPPTVRGTSANGAWHVHPLHVNKDAARVDIGRAYIFSVIGKIIYIMKGMFVLCGKHVGPRR